MINMSIYGFRKTKKTTYSILTIRILENQAKNTNGDHIIYFLDLICFHHKPNKNQKKKRKEKFTMKKYEVLGGNLPVVVCELSAGESMITESGSMSWMTPNMKMETISGGGMKKMFGRLMSGDSMFQNRYTAEGADGTIAFASSFPGAIKALDIRDGHSMIVQKSAFLASEEGVELSMHFQKKLGKGMFGGEGFIMQKLSGNGTAFVEIDGHAVEYELDAGQEILISTGYLAAMEETCTMDVVAVKGVKNMLVGGEGVFNTVVRGPGKVILQTMPISKVAELLTPFFTKNK